MTDEGGISLAKGGKWAGCTTIQDGTLETSTGDVIVPGYDQWGYNYQAYIFNGMYCDSYRDAAWCQPYTDVKLQMKWNGAWLDNKSCDDDLLLDRHHGHDSYIGSGAWLTNHQSGEYEEDGETFKWNYFVKIVAAPADANVPDAEPEANPPFQGTIWYAADGTEIGPVIWWDFAIIQQVENDQGTGVHGILSLSPVGPGFGKFKP